jgi:hypothetical protein
MTTQNEDMDKRLVAFERRVLRRLFERIQVNENWRKPHNIELIQLFVDLDIPYFHLSEKVG